MNTTHRWNINITCPRCQHVGDVEVDFECDNVPPALERAANEGIAEAHNDARNDRIRELEARLKTAIDAAEAYEEWRQEVVGDSFDPTKAAAILKRANELRRAAKAVSP